MTLPWGLGSGKVEIEAGPFIETENLSVGVGLQGDYTEDPCSNGCIAATFGTSADLGVGVGVEVEVYVDPPLFATLKGECEAEIYGAGSIAFSAGAPFLGNDNCSSWAQVTIGRITAHATFEVELEINDEEWAEWTTPEFQIEIWRGVTYP